MSPTRLSGRPARPASRPQADRSSSVRARRVGTIGVLIGAAVLLSGCSAEEASRAWLLEPATEEGNRILSLWVGSWIAAAAVGLLTAGLIMWAVFAYSAKRRPGYPEQTRYNLPIEILYTVVPLIMIGVLFVFTVRDQNEVLDLRDDPDVTVNVVGFRWSWVFNYTSDDAYDIGIPATTNVFDARQGDGEEGYTGPTLVLPEGERVRFVLTTPDVIHSFYVPAFLMKMDMIPGRTNQFEITPNRAGSYLGKCAELCGLDHSRMLFNVDVVPRAEYEQHIQDLKDAGQEGSFDAGRISDLADQGQGRTLTGTDKGREEEGTS